MARIWKERLNPAKHRNPMAEADSSTVPARSSHRDVYLVEVCSFTFEFHSLSQLEACLAFYDRKLHPSSRLNARGGDHWEFQRWFERLPMYLREEPKRIKVAKALRRALLLFGKRSNPAFESGRAKERRAAQRER